MAVLHALGVETRWVRVPAHLLERGRGHVDVHSAHVPAAATSPADAPVRVCVHGLGGSHLNWAPAAPLLAAGGEVWAPDLAGFGYTEPRGRRATLEDNLDLLGGFVQRVSRGRPVLLLGSSMGGLLALLLAAARPELVAGLVVVGAALPPPVQRPDPVVAVRFALTTTPGIGRLWLGRRFRDLTPAEQLRESLELCAVDPDEIDPEYVHAQVRLLSARRRMPHAVPSTLVATRSLLRRLGPGRRGVWRAVATAPVPGLVLQGGRDRLINPLGARRLAELRPDWVLREYDDLGHIVMVEDPERVAEDVALWAQTVRRRVPGPPLSSAGAPTHP